MFHIYDEARPAKTTVVLKRGSAASGMLAIPTDSTTLSSGMSLPPEASMLEWHVMQGSQELKCSLSVC